MRKVITIKDFEDKYGVHFTLNHTGKMKGMISFSTHLHMNWFCDKHRKVAGSVYQKCFAIKHFKVFKNNSECFERNFKVFTEQIIPKNEMPTLNAQVVRLESFGDVANWKQVVNYFNLCKANPSVKFAVWTKNPELYSCAIKMGFKKPKNLIIVLSSVMLNEQLDVNKWDFVDKVFTVYTKDYIEQNNVDINCGGMKCIECQRCYKKRGSKYINEKLK